MHREQRFLTRKQFLMLCITGLSAGVVSDWMGISLRRVIGGGATAGLGDSSGGGISGDGYADQGNVIGEIVSGKFDRMYYNQGGGEIGPFQCEIKNINRMAELQNDRLYIEPGEDAALLYKLGLDTVHKWNQFVVCGPLGGGTCFNASMIYGAVVNATERHSEFRTQLSVRAPTHTWEMAPYFGTPPGYYPYTKKSIWVGEFSPINDVHISNKTRRRLYIPLYWDDASKHYVCQVRVL